MCSLRLKPATGQYIGVGPVKPAALLWEFFVNCWQLSASVGGVLAVEAWTQRRTPVAPLRLLPVSHYRPPEPHTRTRMHTRTHTQPWKWNAIKWLQRRSSTVRWKWPFISASLSAAVLLTAAVAAAIPPRRASPTASRGRNYRRWEPWKQDGFLFESTFATW